MGAKGLSLTQCIGVCTDGVVKMTDRLSCLQRGGVGLEYFPARRQRARGLKLWEPPAYIIETALWGTVTAWSETKHRYDGSGVEKVYIPSSPWKLTKEKFFCTSVKEAFARYFGNMPPFLLKGFYISHLAIKIHIFPLCPWRWAREKICFPHYALQHKGCCQLSL